MLPPVNRSSAICSSLFVWLFLIDASVSLLDDSLIVFFEAHALTGIRSLLSVISGLVGFLVYSLMGITLWIPKRLFLPLALFNAIAGLVVIHLPQMHQLVEDDVVGDKFGSLVQSAGAILVTVHPRRRVTVGSEETGNYSTKGNACNQSMKLSGVK